jgi:hypothetical protein
MHGRTHLEHGVGLLCVEDLLPQVGDELLLCLELELFCVRRESMTREEACVSCEWPPGRVRARRACVVARKLVHGAHGRQHVMLVRGTDKVFSPPVDQHNNKQHNGRCVRLDVMAHHPTPPLDGHQVATHPAFFKGVRHVCPHRTILRSHLHRADVCMRCVVRTNARWR